MSGRKQWIMGGFDALVQGGVRAVRVEAIARAIGVTKGSFYHHFSGREELLGALLDQWGEHDTEAIIALVDAHEAPRDRLRALVRVIFDAPRDGIRIEVAVRAWATSDARALAAVEAIDNRRLDYVEAILRQAGVDRDRARARTEVLYRAVVGDMMRRASGAAPLPTFAQEDLIALLCSDVRAAL